MKIDQGALVSLDIMMYDAQGNLLEHSDEPLVYLHGHDDVFPRVEAALAGKEAGERVALQLEPEEAFGDYDDQLVFLEPRGLFPQELEEGMTFEGLPAGGNPDAPKNVLYTVTEIYPEHVVLDGNHPLAGIAIRLHLKVEAVREATEEEVGRGSAGTGFFTVQRAAPGGTTLH